MSDSPGAPGASAVTVLVSIDDVDLASGLLWGTGVTAISEVEDATGRVLLTADLPPGGLAAVEAALGGRWPVAPLVIADDGLDGWREHARAVRVGERLVVRPPWVDFGPAEGDLVLSIDPGRAFGHGAHPTTQLCLAAIERLVVPGCSVLDVGSGSGVLAVAAAVLGARPVVAVDVDPVAVDATAANAVANGVEIDCSATPLESVPGRFDLVVANIGSATIVSLAGALSERLAPSGTLLLSGLLSDRTADALGAFGPHLEARVEHRDGWAMVELH